MRSSLSYVVVDKNIAGRYYQEVAIKAVCDSFGKKNRRKRFWSWPDPASTRTVIALVKVLQSRDGSVMYFSGGPEFSCHAGKTKLRESSS